MKDNSEVFYQNLSMFYNLLANQDKFNQLISFGSGAELGYPTDPYVLHPQKNPKQDYNLKNVNKFYAEINFNTEPADGCQCVACRM